MRLRPVLVAVCGLNQLLNPRRRAAQWLALGALGLGYLLLIVAGVAVLDDVLNGPALSGVVTTYIRG